MNTIKLATVLLQTVLQVFCIMIALQAYRDRKSNGQRAFWKWFAAGFSFQLVRRVMYLLVILGVPVPELRFITFIVVPTCVSICYTVAMVQVIQYARERARTNTIAHTRLQELAKGYRCERS